MFRCVKIFRLFLFCWGFGGVAMAQLPTTFPGTGSGTGRPGLSGTTQPSRQPRADGRILDDSTRQVYGPRTTRYFLEADVFNNRKILYMPDTVIDGFHQYNFVQRSNYTLVDLGILGTAMRPVFYQTPDQIGAQVGYNAYTPYAFQPQQIKYYDTKSPFSNMYFVSGGLGQNILEFGITRNAGPRFNAGFNLFRSTAVKQFGPPANNEENLLGIWNFLIHANYASKNEKYTALGHFNLFVHRSNDQGGVLFDDQITPTSLFRLGTDQGTQWLGQSSSEDRRNTLHLYHQYKLANGFQLYHVFDYHTRANRFLDNAPITGLSNGFYRPLSLESPQISFGGAFQALSTPDTTLAGVLSRTRRIDSTIFSVQTTYHLLENKVGVKGFYKGFNYRVHLRRRDYSLQNQYNFYETKRSENFLGAWLNYYFADSTKAFAELEYLVGKDYRLHAEYQGKFLTAGFSQVLNSPSLIQQRFFSSLYYWDNDFRNTFTLTAFGQLNLRIKGVLLQPTATYQLIDNYIYFDTLARPRQQASIMNVLRVGTGASWRWKKFSTINQVMLTATTGGDVLRMPRLMINSRLAYDLLFKKILYIQAGLELHYKSSYLADAYMPATQQFYLNNSFRVNGYVVADAFADFRINRVRLFVKMSHVNQGIIPPGGYYTSAYFPATRRVFGFGVNWLLFD